MPVAPGEQKLVSTPFLPLDDSINAVLENQLTGSASEENADAVLKWDPMLNEYIGAHKAAGTGDAQKDGQWFSDFKIFTPSPMTILPGDGFILCNRQSQTQTVHLAGEVVLDNTVDIEMKPGLSLFGVPFAGATEIGGTDLNAKETVAEDGKLKMGKGYWYNREGEEALIWKAARPYANVFPGDNALPRVRSIVGSDKGVVITIKTSGVDGETLDIFSQDIPCDGSFDPLSGWKVSTKNLKAKKGILSWTDNPNDLPGPLVARCYLVVRSDIDTDGDLIPDSYEIFITGTHPLIPDEGASVPGTASVGVPEEGPVSPAPVVAATAAKRTGGPRVKIPSPINRSRTLR